MHSLPTYTVGAEVYDLWWPEGSVGNDEAFYDSFADGRKNILELGCGTGRILTYLARRGRAVTGIDASRSMLDLCEEKLRREGLAAPLLCAKMQDFRLDGSFDLILVPFHSFMILSELADARKALTGIKEHLAEGGLALVSLFVPKYESLSQNQGADIVWRRRKELADPKTGKRVVISDAVRNHCFEQIKDVYYRFQFGDSPEGAPVEHMKMRWYFPHEFALFAESAGLKVEKAYGDYSREPLGPHHREMVFALRRGGDSA